MSFNVIQKIRQALEPKAAVLMYHRIVDLSVDPWQLAVQPHYFEEQLQVITKSYNVVPVPELITALQKKTLKHRTVCLTFDDGYTDNLLFAKPLLEQYQCPATFFIPSAYTGKQQPFWWDELEALLLAAPALPSVFNATINGKSFDFNLGTAAVLTPEHITKHKGWAWPQPAPDQRCALYLLLWEELKPLPYEEIQTAMQEIRNWSGYTPSFDKAGLPMDKMQLHEMAANPLFRIGLHTATHPALAYHPEDVQYSELAENKKVLQPYQPLNAVAFPYGNYNKSTISVLRRQRIDAGFTTEEKKVTPHTNPHCLGRFQVKNWNGADFKKALSKWFKA
jgi:peptidoglycan/xylan/chitin deacetylase (PgdA/CDA1 family)